MEIREILLIAFAFAWIFEFVLFGMQRATLLISRNAGLEWRGGGELLLPSWFPLTWVVKIGKWGVLLSIAYIWDWKVALGLLIADIVLSAILPIPYAAYKGIFRKRVTSVTVENPELGSQLKQLLDSAPF